MRTLEIPCDIPDNQRMLLKIGITLYRTADGHYKAYMPYERTGAGTLKELRFTDRFLKRIEKTLRELEKERKAKRKMTKEHPALAAASGESEEGETK